MKITFTKQDYTAFAEACVAFAEPTQFQLKRPRKSGSKVYTYGVQVGNQKYYGAKAEAIWNAHMNKGKGALAPAAKQKKATTPKAKAPAPAKKAAPKSKTPKANPVAKSNTPASEIQKVPEPEPIRMETAKKEEKQTDPVKHVSDAIDKVSNDSATVMKQAESIVPKLQKKLESVSPEVKKEAQEFIKDHGPAIQKKLEENNVSPSLLKKIAGAGLVALAGPAALTAGITAILPGAMISSGVLTESLGTILGGVFLNISGFHKDAASLAWDAAQGLYSKGMKMMGKKFAEDDEMKLAKKLAKEIMTDLAQKWQEHAKKKGLK